MSYDISIGQFERNYTSNGSALWHDHYKGGECVDENGVVGQEPSGLEALDGKTGREAGEIILQMLQAINDTRVRLGNDREKGEPAMSEKYDAPNGWGSVIGQLIFIGEVAAACAMYPDDTVTVCF